MWNKKLCLQLWCLNYLTELKHIGEFLNNSRRMVLFYCYEIVLNIEVVTLTGNHSGASSHCSTVVTELLYGYEGTLGKEIVTVIRS